MWETEKGQSTKAEAREFFHCILVPKIPAVLQGEELVLSSHHCRDFISFWLLIVH